MAHLERTGQGAFGSIRDYFDSTVATLGVLGLRDARIERLRTRGAARRCLDREASDRAAHA